MAGIRCPIHTGQGGSNDVLNILLTYLTMTCRLMYWMNANDTIMVANLDGTRRREFLRLDGGQFDGMVVDARRQRFATVFHSLLQVYHPNGSKR